MNTTTPRYNRQSLERRAERLGLQLSKAGFHARSEAASANDPIPRWELSDGKWQSSIRGYSTLADVADALDWREAR